MNLYHFIGSRIIAGNKKSFSSTVYWISVILIALGVSLTIISVCVLEGFKKTIRDKIFDMGAHIQVIYGDNNQSYEETQFNYNTEFYKDWKSFEHITHVQRFSHKAGFMEYKRNLEGVVLKGVSTDFDTARLKACLVEGSLPDLKDPASERQIVVSKIQAEKLRLKPGNKTTFFFYDTAYSGLKPRAGLLVKGVYETGLEEFDQQIVFCNLSLIQEMTGHSKEMVGGYEVYLDDFKYLDSAHRQIYEYSDADLIAVKITDKYPQLFDWFSILDRNVIIIFTLVMIVLLFNMVSSVLIMIMERSSTIGLLKAMGARNRQIGGMFLYNGLKMIGTGMLIGNALGLGACYLQYTFKFIPLNPENYYMDSVPILWDWFWILALNMLIFFINLVVLLVPLGLISAIRPIRSIKFS